MSTNVAAIDDLNAQQRCPACATTVPAAAFCGHCGATLGVSPRWWRIVLRPGVFAAAPREPVAVPMLTSSLFPYQDARSRMQTRWALALLLAGIAVCAALDWQSPLVTLIWLGLPLLVGVALWQSGMLRDVPGHGVLLAAVLGAALGVVWKLLTAGLIGRSYGMPMVAGFLLEHLLGVGLAATLVGVLLMVVPAVVVRLFCPVVRESLDGFAIGALGSLSFASAAWITGVAPQFATGFTRAVLPMRVAVESALWGLAMPINAVVAGGLVGLALWFRPGPRAREHRALVVLAATSAVTTAVSLYVAVWVIFAARLPWVVMLALQLTLTALGVVGLRVCMQMALLHERSGPDTGLPVLCPHCDRVVPEMAFCPACGAGALASTRTARREGREYRPVREAQSD